MTRFFSQRLWYGVVRYRAVRQRRIFLSKPENSTFKDLTVHMNLTASFSKCESLYLQGPHWPRQFNQTLSYWGSKSVFRWLVYDRNGVFLHFIFCEAQMFTKLKIPTFHHRSVWLVERWRCWSSEVVEVDQDWWRLLFQPEYCAVAQWIFAEPSPCTVSSKADCQLGLKIPTSLGILKKSGI